MRFHFILVPGLVISASFLACGSGDDCDFGNCGQIATEGGSETSSGGEGGMTDGPVIDAPAGCDLTKEPKDSPACVDDGVGVFVDARKGTDSAAGTKAAPVKTIKAALEKAGQKRVYVCEGNYSEPVKLTSAASIYGGFACTSWTYSASKPNVSPPSGYALEIANVSGDVLVSDLGFSAAPGTTSNRSSIAAFVVASPKVTFLRSSLEAASGKEGAEGVSGESGSITAVLPAGPLNATGIGSNGITAGSQKTCTCSSGGTSTGGGGGAPNAQGGPGQPAIGAGAGGSGMVSCNPTGFGSNGSDQGPASDATTMSKVGALDASGWTPTAGSDGSPGTPGQGGGGGGGRDGSSAGGGGACGGCGGTAGKGGSGGGASIALLAVDSAVTLRQSSLTTKAAGAGGKGGAGGSGVAGGAGGGFSGGSNGCSGGDGGRGGDGGAGGGGAGGVSVGVLYKGAKPNLESTTVSTGDLGGKGDGGKKGMNDGIDGKKADTLEIN